MISISVSAMKAEVLFIFGMSRCFQAKFARYRHELDIRQRKHRAIVPPWPGRFIRVAAEF